MYIYVYILCLFMYYVLCISSIFMWPVSKISVVISFFVQILRYPSPPTLTSSHSVASFSFSCEITPSPHLVKKRNSKEVAILEAWSTEWPIRKFVESPAGSVSKIQGRRRSNQPFFLCCCFPRSLLST